MWNSLQTGLSAIRSLLTPKTKVADCVFGWSLQKVRSLETRFRSFKDTARRIADSLASRSGTEIGQTETNHLAVSPVQTTEIDQRPSTDGLALLSTWSGFGFTSSQAQVPNLEVHNGSFVVPAPCPEVWAPDDPARLSLVPLPVDLMVFSVCFLVLLQLGWRKCKKTNV